MITDEMVEKAREAFRACRPVDRVACQDFGMQQDDMLDQQLEAALTAALGGAVVVPAELTEDMRYATWYAQFKHSGATDAEAHTLTCRRMAENGQRLLDQAAYRAMVAAASTVTRHNGGGAHE
jgi:Rod binding domain-containing protein